MNIIQRNFFRLIRYSTSGIEEQIEPMSVFKWEQLYQLALMHDVAETVYEGLEKSRNQFFLHQTDQQWKRWEKTAEDLRKHPRNDDAEEDEFLRADHLTNPLLNRKLQSILDDEHSDIQTRRLLLDIISVSRHILNEGQPVRQLINLGKELRQQAGRIDTTTLGKWIKSLKMEQVAAFEGALLMELLHFKQEEIPFAGTKARHVERMAQELIEFTNTRAADFYFSQDGNAIFVHTSNGSAMLGHIRRSAHYFRYYPSETLTNFFVSFAHSLTHIEE